MAFDKGEGQATVPHMPQVLSDKDIETALASLEGWSRDGEALTRTLKFENFREALSFMVRAGFEAEAMDHHPDWTNVYNRVTIRLNTHSAGGKITELDVELAKRLQKISWVN